MQIQHQIAFQKFSVLGMDINLYKTLIHYIIQHHNEAFIKLLNHSSTLYTDNRCANSRTKIVYFGTKVKLTFK